MPPQSTATERLKNITASLNITADTLKVLAEAIKTPFLGGDFEHDWVSPAVYQGFLLSLILNELAEYFYIGFKKNLIHAFGTAISCNMIIMVHVSSSTCGELPATMLKQIGKFTETLHKIHTFFEAQQSGSKIKSFVRQGEMTALLKDCEAGLQQGLELFQVQAVNIVKDIEEMEKEATLRHHDVLNMIEELSDTTGSDGASSVWEFNHDQWGLLGFGQEILHGRELELADILTIFNQGPTRIAILGAGGMGKPSLARAIVHDEEIATRYEQHRFFIACDSAATKVELATAIGSHVGIKPGKDLDLTLPLVQYFSSNPPSLLILDNLETLWEPSETRADIEDFLSLLTDVAHLALLITMRGAERPGKVCWTQPFAALEGR
ncbi:hypothetical protein B0H19DRAFT_1084021 [Mycena capillaripes]|nr:hypothetical protein B0H19DRAFT_1084021 [Mycena capillaripes]